MIPRHKTPKTNWWEADDETLHAVVLGVANRLWDDASTVREAYRLFLSIYTNRNITSLTGGTFQDAVDISERIRLNVTKSAIDASVALIGANRPRPLVMSVKGNYDTMKRAERLTRFVNGMFHHTDQWGLGLNVFAAACVFGTGWQAVYPFEGDLCTELVPPWEMLFDKVAAERPNPHWYIRASSMPKWKMTRMYPEYEEIIESAGLKDESIVTTDSAEDQATMYEAVHVWEGKGRFVRFTDSGILEDKTCKRWPVIPFHWNTVPGFFTGQGAVEELQPIQIEIDYIAQKIQRLMTLATSVILKKRGANFSKVTNKDWEQYEFSGNEPPQFANIRAVSAEYFTHLDRLYQRAFEIVGVSQLAAQSLKPKGLDSGEALRVYNDIGTKRFAHTAQRWESFHMNVAKLMIETVREMGGSTKVLAGDENEVEELDWKNCSIEENRYKLRVRPTSILPDEPAGKVEMLKVFAQVLAQTQTPDAGTYMLHLMGTIPDLERALDTENLPRDLAENMVNEILEHGKAQSPFPSMNMKLTRLIASQAELRAERDGVEEGRRSLLRSFIAQVDNFLMAEQQAMIENMLLAQGGPPGGGPPGAPGVPGPQAPQPQAPNPLQTPDAPPAQ